MAAKGEYTLLLITELKNGKQRARALDHFMTDDQIKIAEQTWRKLATHDRSIKAVRFGKVKTATYEDMAKRGECPPIPGREVPQ